MNNYELVEIDGVLLVRSWDELDEQAVREAHCDGVHTMTRRTRLSDDYNKTEFDKLFGG